MVRASGHRFANAAGDRRGTSPPASRDWRPCAAVVGEDGESCAKLLAVLVDHHVHLRRIGGQRRIADMRAEDGKHGDQPRLRRGRFRARLTST